MFLQLIARQHLRFRGIANNVKNFNTCLVLFAIKECKPANYNEINVWRKYRFPRKFCLVPTTNLIVVTIQTTINNNACLLNPTST